MILLDTDHLSLLKYPDNLRYRKLLGRLAASGEAQQEKQMSATAPQLSDKQLVAQALDRMPETVSLEQISEELAILAAIRRGEQAVAEGRVVSHEEVKQRSTAWTGQSSGQNRPWSGAEARAKRP